MGHQAGTHSESEAGDGSAQIRASSLGRVHAWRKPREAAESGLQQRHGTVVPSQRVSPRRYTPPPPRCTMLRASIRAFAKRSGSKRASVRLYQKDHRATAAPPAEGSAHQFFEALSARQARRRRGLHGRPPGHLRILGLNEGEAHVMPLNPGAGGLMRRCCGSHPW